MKRKIMVIFFLAAISFAGCPPLGEAAETHDKVTIEQSGRGYGQATFEIPRSTDTNDSSLENVGSCNSDIMFGIGVALVYFGLIGKGAVALASKTIEAHVSKHAEKATDNEIEFYNNQAAIDISDLKNRSQELEKLISEIIHVESQLNLILGGMK